MVGYPPPCCTSDLRPTPSPLDISPLLLTSGGQHWRPLQTCSLEDPPRSDIWWWPLKHVRFASGRYASYWNAFLFLAIFTSLSVLSKGLWKAMTNQNSTVGRKEWLTSRGVTKDRGAKELNVHSINEIKFILLSNLIHLPVRWNVFEMAPNEVYYQYAFRRNGIWLVFGMFENKWQQCVEFRVGPIFWKFKLPNVSVIWIGMLLVSSTVSGLFTESTRRISLCKSKQIIFF